MHKENEDPSFSTQASSFTHTPRFIDSFVGGHAMEEWHVYLSASSGNIM